MENKIQLFEDRRIRYVWDAEREEWLFSVVDVVGALTDQPDLAHARNYWKVLKNRLKKEGNESVTNCNQLKMLAANGEVAKDARLNIEKRTGASVISSANANDKLRLEVKPVE